MRMLRISFRRLILCVTCALGLGLSGTGCVFNQYASDPTTRTDQLLNQSEDLRQIGQTWRRFWFNDQPSHMSPERIHGGIL